MNEEQLSAKVLELTRENERFRQRIEYHKELGSEEKYWLNFWKIATAFLIALLMSITVWVALSKYTSIVVMQSALEAGHSPLAAACADSVMGSSSLDESVLCASFMHLDK